MIRLLIDQGLPMRAATDLRGEGWEVQHVSELGMHQALDDEIVDYAAKHSLVIVTHDSDFSQLMTLRGLSSPSIVHIRVPRVTRTRLVNLLKGLVPRLGGDLAAGCIVSVDEAGVRVRKIPVG